jgi:phosphatidylinositol 4-kinase
LPTLGDVGVKAHADWSGSAPSETLTRASLMISQPPGRLDKGVRAGLAKSQITYLDKNCTDQTLIPTLVSLVSYLLCDFLQMLNAYIRRDEAAPNVQRLLALNQMKVRNMHLNQTVPVIWKLAPECLYAFATLPRIGETVTAVICQLADRDIYTAASVPDLALLFASTAKLSTTGLLIWRPVSAIRALVLLRADMMKERHSASYVARCFSHFTRDESLLFLPQLVQSLRFDTHGVLKDFLIHYCKSSEVFCHYLLWNILSEKENQVGAQDNLPEILTAMESSVLENMSPLERSNYEAEFGFIDELDRVSQRLLPMAIDERPPALGDMLAAMAIPENLYIPSNPNYRILSIDAEHSVPLKSHARVPILVHFKVFDEADQDRKPIPFSCIFKIQDDVRQDAMMIQFIDTCKRIFDDAGLDTYVLPYRVFATGPNRGVIECIPAAKSRHDLGRSTSQYLLEYFVGKYGQVGTPAFQTAQENFIKSMAPYSLICYLFQVKDRHNANIMIDEAGHVLHIDFGFIFEISPGGNFKFERSPFKLTREMIDVMGGGKEAPAFRQFAGLLTKCFLATRARHEELEAIAFLMMSAGFPCFRADSIKKLQQRFFLDKGERDVIVEIQQLINEAYEAMTTTVYDTFQMASNQIFF